MKGSVIREKILSKGYKLMDVAEKLGMSSQNFYSVAINNDNVKSETIEEIAAAINEPVSYFYNEYPILTIEDYEKVVRTDAKLKLMETIVAEQQATIELLESIIKKNNLDYALPDRTKTIKE